MRSSGDPQGSHRVLQSMSRLVKRNSENCSRQSQYSKSEHEITGHEPQSPQRGRRQGAKPLRYSPHPLQGEHGVLNQLPESSESQLQADSTPPAGPCQKFFKSLPKSTFFLTSESEQFKITKCCLVHGSGGSFWTSFS